MTVILPCQILQSLAKIAHYENSNNEVYTQNLLNLARFKKLGTKCILLEVIAIFVRVENVGGIDIDANIASRVCALL